METVDGEGSPVARGGQICTSPSENCGIADADSDVAGMSIVSYWVVQGPGEVRPRCIHTLLWTSSVAMCSTALIAVEALAGPGQLCMLDAARWMWYWSSRESEMICGDGGIPARTVSQFSEGQP